MNGGAPLGGKWKYYACALVIVIAIACLVAVVDAPSKENPPLFRTEMRAVQICFGKGPIRYYMLAHNSPSGTTISPVELLVYIQVTNLQNIPSTIHNCATEFSAYSDEPWSKLYPMALTGNALYMIGAKSFSPTIDDQRSIVVSTGIYSMSDELTSDDLKYAVLLNPRKKLEDYFQQPIPAHGTISGWAAYGSEDGIVMGNVFRVHIVDGAGIDSYSSLELVPDANYSRETDTQTPILDILPHTSLTDLSNCSVRN
jgi:hypothetical protein